MKKTLFFVLLMSLNTCYPQFIQYRGLGNTYTTDLTIYNDTLYASTYDGLYKHGLQNFINPHMWIPCGMQGRHVVQTFVPDYQTFISLVEIDSSHTTQIYKSTDGGATFSLMNPDTSDMIAYMYLDQMAHPPGNYDTLYFLHHHLKTYDGGVTWDTIHSQLLNDRFISVNPNNHNELIIGGETMILSAYIQVSPDRGDTWNLPLMNGYFAGDNAVHDLAMEYSSDWYAAGEGVICNTTDHGDNWSQQLNMWSGSPDFALYNWDIEIGTYGTYVTGSNSGAMKVPLIWKYIINSYWDTLSAIPFDTLNPEMRCLAVTPAPFGEDIYLGGHGIYVYNVVIGGIAEKEKNNFHIYPNPFQGNLIIETDMKHQTGRLTASVYNSLGKYLYRSEINTGRAELNLSSLPDGLYYIRVTDEKGNYLFTAKRNKL